MSTPRRYAAGSTLGPPQPEARSESERETARRERAARRAAQGSDGAPAPPRAARPSAPSQPPPSRDGQAPRARTGRLDGGGGLPPTGRRPPRERGPDEVRRRQLVYGAVGLGAILLLWFLVGFWSPFAGDGDESVRVRIPKGAGVGQIGDILDEKGVVKSAAVFSARVRVAGRGDELKPGTYTLRSGMSYGAALDQLAAGPTRNVVNVTIPEGRARGEIAPIVESAGLDGSYSRATARSSRLDPSDYGAESAESLEGFLYPSTYELARGSSARDLVARQLAAFKREFGKVDTGPARSRQLTPYEVLVIASMVEREAQLDRERPLIASVIYNRLKRGEPLGIDATIRYATKNWDQPLTQSQLAISSPYNTRRNAGLPPGPIGNPGIASIRAAAKPAQGDFLFYVVKPNTCGEHAFSRTMEEFNRDSQPYNSERAARGGKSPDDCPR